MTRKHIHPRPPAALPEDRSWAARATALKREGPAQWAVVAAILASLTMLAGWVAVLIPPGGSIRLNPVFWLLAAPLMPWFWGVQSFAAWAVKTLWLALLLAPALSLLALFVAPMLREANVLEGGGTYLDTEPAMLVIMALTTLLALAGLLALRRSSLPGGTRAVTYLAPDTPIPGFTKLPPAATGMLKLGSLPFSGTLINGGMFTIVATLDPVGPAGMVWPAILLAIATLTVGTLLFRGGFRLARRRPGAASDLRHGWRLGMACTVAALPALWVWPTLLTGKLVFSGFMIPLALAAVWCGRRALQMLPEINAAR